MRIIYGTKKIKRFRKPVVALGIFDGVHLGHIQILKALVRKARSIHGESIVVTFSPHPQKKGSIYSLEHRLRLMTVLGIDICIVIRFSKVFSMISADNFVKDILVDKIGAFYIYVGRNFTFGKDASGNFRILNKLSNIYNFKLKVFDVLKINHKPISSTYIRRLIKQGKLNSAEKLLSRPVSVLGTVIKGSSLARRLGFPTANIDPHHEVMPPNGIYAVRIIFDKKISNGICYIGTKPTFSNQNGINVEVHIFDFYKSIYGKQMEIQFIQKIRDETKFVSTRFLIRQIKKDILLAKKILSRH